MTITITTKGLIGLYRDGVLISEHTVETKAVERALEHADDAGDGVYRIKYPEKELMARKIRIIPVPVTRLPPSAPLLSHIEPTPVAGVCTVYLSWSESAPATGSTVASYKVYQDGVLIESGNTSRTKTVTGLSEGVMYQFKVTAVSDQGLESQLSNDAAVSWPDWTDALSSVFNLTAGETFDRTFKASDLDSDTVPFNWDDLDVPDWVSIAVQEQTGTERQIRIYGVAPSTATTADFLINLSSSDWLDRSSGAVFADRLDTQAVIAGYIVADSATVAPALDTTVKPPGSVGSAKFTVSPTNSTADGQLRIPFGVSYGNGSEFWVSYREYVPASWAFQPWLTESPSANGNKHSIISRVANSNTVNELVISQNGSEGNFTGYYQDGGASSGINEQIDFASTVNASDFREQSALNRATSANSGAFVTYPLTGTDPDTGSAWSAWQQERARYGSIYSARSGLQATDYRRGLGDPISGGFRPYPNEWVTITQRVIVGTFNTLSSRWTVWAAREGQPYVKLWDKTNISLGGADGPYAALWLLPYVTGRSANTGVRVSARTNAIPGVTLHAAGTGTPVGAGSLEYNATTQRFRWAGLGESFGTARGFSVANNKLFLNVISTGQSYLIIEIDPSLLPGITTTETVTIASPRGSTQVNYADVIVSTSAINAPGGYAPT
jgi:hypothetical protein